MINQHSPDTGADDVSIYVKPHSFNGSTSTCSYMYRGLYNHGV